MVFDEKKIINPDDVLAIFQKYDTEKVITLLKEVAHYVYTQHSKIDWEVLVEGTKTGITSAKEYQRLWRHLAYRNDLVDRLDCGVEPLDDDSDLECELEASPAVSNEALTDVSACVKELISSCLPSHIQLRNSAVEAPLNVETTNGQLSTTCLGKSPAVNLVRGTKLPLPVSSQKQCRPTLTSTQASDANVAAAGPSRKKKKKWTDAEDAALIAAVQKFGDSSWGIILKELGVEKSTGQLSQRWGTLKKQKVNMNVVVPDSTRQQRSQAQLDATRHAMSMALNMPVGNLSKPGSVSNVGVKSVSVNHSTAPSEALPTSSSYLSSHMSKQASAQTLPENGLNPALRSRPAARKPPSRSNITPNVLQAAAVAAGARIATPEDAASLLKAAHANNAVHIMPGGGSLNTSSSMSMARVSNITPKKVESIQENRVCLSGNAATQLGHEDLAASLNKEAVDKNQMTRVNEQKVHLQESRALPSDTNQSQQIQAEKCLSVSVAAVELQRGVENPKSSKPSDMSITVSDQGAIAPSVHIKVGCENQSTQDAIVKEGGDYRSTIQCKVA